MSTVICKEKPEKSKTITIIVNGRPREINDRKLSYIEVVQLAFPGEKPSETLVFTVTYSTPRGREDSMVEGDVVRVKKGTIFNVRKTDKS